MHYSWILINVVKWILSSVYLMNSVTSPYKTFVKRKNVNFRNIFKKNVVMWTLIKVLSINILENKKQTVLKKSGHLYEHVSIYFSA